MRGVTSRTRLYRVVYAVLGPLYPGMIAVARHGYARRLLENRDINALAAPALHRA